MLKRWVIFILCFTFLLCITACEKTENTEDNPSPQEITSKNNDQAVTQFNNSQIIEDLNYFKTELPKRHKNLFALIPQESFNQQIDQLISKIDQLNEEQIFVELKKIVASVGDAHTNVNFHITDYDSFPLQFWIFDGNVYVVSASPDFEEMIYAKVLKIDGDDIDTVVKELTSLIPHENESWPLTLLPRYLHTSYYLYGLNIIKIKDQAVFTVQKDDVVQDFTVPSINDSDNDQSTISDFVDQDTKNVFIGTYKENYSYEYLAEQNALYFEYNSCSEKRSQSFKNFNTEMFQVIEEHDVDKIIIDLRSNSGGNSEILNPFTEQLEEYVEDHPDVKVYTLVGRKTFSSGMFAIYRIKEAAPDAISVGEPTGGALDCYGEVKSFQLPNSKLVVRYSTKYFEFTSCFSYHNDGVGTFLPEISIQPTIEDYINHHDVVLNYVLEN